MTDSPKFAVVLSGCGVYDGAEIHESVLSLLAIQKNGGGYKCFAPDVDQHHVIDHTSGTEMAERRNVLVESARIARGDIQPLSDFDPGEFDVLMFPGGFGAAKNLSTFAFEGAACAVNGDVEAAVRATVDAGKPVVALCIAPAVMAKILDGPTLTIGQDADTAAAIESMGATHTPTGHGDIVVDRNLKLVTSPCYMLDATITQIATGADNAVKAALELI